MFGDFTPPFGFELPTSSAVRESPERSPAFADTTAAMPVFKTTVNATGGVVTPGTVLPLFVNQESDQGLAMTLNPARSTRVILGVFNGEGTAPGGTRNQNNALDLLGRVQTNLLHGNLGLGLSGYYGALAVRSGAPTGNPATPTGFVNAYRMLGGADVRYVTPWGTVLRAEYVGGVYEMTPDRAQYLENNHAYAWYFTVRQPVNRRLELAAKYDEFYPISQGNKFAGGLGRMALVRKDISAGLLYWLDPATRFRLWYMKGLTPYDPSAPSGPLRGRLGFLTGEVQISY